MLASRRPRSRASGNVCVAVASPRHLQPLGDAQFVENVRDIVGSVFLSADHVIGSLTDEKARRRRWTAFENHNSTWLSQDE